MTDELELPPSWFDDGAHVVTPGGIMERATGVMLDGDGEPQSPVERAKRRIDAAEAQGNASGSPRGRRGREQAAAPATEEGN